MAEHRYTNPNPIYEFKEQQIYFHLMEEYLKRKKKSEFSLYDFAEYIYEERLKLLEVNTMSTDIGAISFRIARLVHNRQFMLETKINLIENREDPFSSLVVTENSDKYTSPRVTHKEVPPEINIPNQRPKQ